MMTSEQSTNDKQDSDFDDEISSVKSRTVSKSEVTVSDNTGIDSVGLKTNKNNSHEVVSIIMMETEVKSHDQLDRQKSNISVQNGDVTSDKLPNENTQIDENDLDEYDPDLFITDEERKAFEFMLEQRREEVLKQKENFKNWVDSITRRRMFALSRLRKIHLGHKERMKFYDKINEYIKTADTVIQTNNNFPQSKGSQNDDFHKESNKKFEDMVRENTGFVIKNENGNQVNITNSTGHDSIYSNGEYEKSNRPKEKETSANGSKMSNGQKNDDLKHNKTDNTPKIVHVQS